MMMVLVDISAACAYSGWPTAVHIFVQMISADVATTSIAQQANFIKMMKQLQELIYGSKIPTIVGVTTI